MFFFILYFLALFCVQPVYAHMHEETVTGDISCRISFKHGKYDFDKEKVLKECLNIPVKMIDSIEITGSTSTIGSKAFNKKLAEKRSQVIAEVLRSNGYEQTPMQIKIIPPNAKWNKSAIVKIKLKVIENDLLISTNKENTRECIQKLYKNHVYLGLMVNANSNFNKYSKSPMLGMEINISRNLYQWSDKTTLYAASVFNQMRGRRDTEEENLRIDLIDYGLHAGAKYNLNTFFVPFIEAGFAFGNHWMTKVDKQNSTMFTFESNEFLFSNQLGFIGYFLTKEDFDFSYRFALRSTVGREKSYDSVNLNAWSASTVFSLGIVF